MIIVIILHNCTDDKTQALSVKRSLFLYSCGQISTSNGGKSPAIGEDGLQLITLDLESEKYYAANPNCSSLLKTNQPKKQTHNPHWTVFYMNCDCKGELKL